MQRKPPVPKIGSAILKSERKSSNLSVRSKPSPCCSHSRIPVRPKSATHCCGATSQPERRPWSSSVYVDRKSSTGHSEKHDANPVPNRKLGHIPAYMKKKRSTASLGKTVEQGTEERLEDEAPPPLVPSEIVLPEKRLQREGTFNQKDDNTVEIVPTEVKQQLEDAVRDLTEEKQMLLAENQWLREESASRQKMIETESQRNKQFEIILRQMTEEMERMRSEQVCPEDIEELRRNQDELKWQVDNLNAKNASLQKENDTFRKQQSEDILCLEEDIEPNQPKPTVEYLERNLVKYRAARRKLKEVVDKLISENHRLRESIENHRNEGSFVENAETGMKENHHVSDVSEDEEIVNRTDYFEERRKQKRSQQKCIGVRKYEL